MRWSKCFSAVPSCFTSSVSLFVIYTQIYDKNCNNFTTFHNFHQINELSFPLNTKKDIAYNIYETLPKSQQDEKKCCLQRNGQKRQSYLHCCCVLYILGLETKYKQLHFRYCWYLSLFTSKCTCYQIYVSG